MMKHFLFTCTFTLLFLIAHAQLPFKFDSQYKTIYASDLCRMLQKNPDILLIDVRSPGEYSDTSQYASLNQGHLKGAINLDIEAIKKDPAQMDTYRDKTIVLYCSHSQRSRRVSKMLAESGFTSFYNLNGGMSVINQLTSSDFPCKTELIVSDLPFKNVGFNEAASLIINEKKLLILDIRPSAQFNSRDSLAANNVGRIKGAFNIPYDQLKQRMNELDMQRPVLVYSSSGDGDAARAANELLTSGFKNVYQMLGGINDFIASQKKIPFVENLPAYTIVDAPRALDLLKNNKNLVIYDTRPDEEYNNKLSGMTSYKNLGHIKNAVHVDKAAYRKLSLPTDKKAPILIYGYEESFELESVLAEKGYSNVYLMEGLYDFVWSGFNVESCKEARNYIVNNEGLY
jgi:rhodanese-related sulfurtransferase